MDDHVQPNRGFIEKDAFYVEMSLSHWSQFDVANEE